jgi:hypothetical protein
MVGIHRYSSTKDTIPKLIDPLLLPAVIQCQPIMIDWLSTVKGGSDGSKIRGWGQDLFEGKLGPAGEEVSVSGGIYVGYQWNQFFFGNTDFNNLVLAAEVGSELNCFLTGFGEDAVYFIKQSVTLQGKSMHIHMKLTLCPTMFEERRYEIVCVKAH